MKKQNIKNLRKIGIAIFVIIVLILVYSAINNHRVISEKSILKELAKESKRAEKLEKSKNKKNAKLYRYYDFNIVVDIQRFDSMDTVNYTENRTRYILCNHYQIWDEVNQQYFSEFENNTLYKIKTVTNHLSFEKDIVEMDTVKTILTKNNIDKFYLLVYPFFQPNKATNLSVDSLPRLSSLYDGPSARLSLDYGFRGDYYSVFVRKSQCNENFIVLINYLEELLKNI